MQGDVLSAGKNSGRFLVNTTIGVLGVFDPANKMGLNPKYIKKTGVKLWVNGDLEKVVT